MEQIIYTMPLNEFQEVLKKCIREELPNTSPVKEDDELIKIEDAAKLFKVSKVTLYKWRKKGILPFYRMGSRIYFKKCEVIDALRSNRKRRQC